VGKFGSFLIKGGFLTTFFFIAVSFSDYILYSGIGLWGVLTTLVFAMKCIRGLLRGNENVGGGWESE
jgi:O-antigen/teichoic acid export membrane protein